MNPQLQTAIIQFLANEFQMDPETLDPETSFTEDLSLNPSQILELLQRMQDSLGFILPEDKITQISTISDILETLAPEPESADKPI